MPPFLARNIDAGWLSEASVQLAIGGARSGAPLHYHKAALNTLVYGRKAWWLAPPRDAAYSSTPVARWAEGGPERYASAGRTLPDVAGAMKRATVQRSATVPLPTFSKAACRPQPPRSGPKSLWLSVSPPPPSGAAEACTHLVNQRPMHSK